MVGEERTPLLPGQGQGLQGQGHGQGYRLQGQGHGLQGQGHNWSRGQEREGERSCLPWSALTLAILAGVSLGLQAFILAAIFGATSLAALSAWLIRICKHAISARRRAGCEDVEIHGAAACPQDAGRGGRNQGITQRLRRENSKLEINVLMIPKLTNPEAISLAAPSCPTTKSHVSISFPEKPGIPTVLGPACHLKLPTAKDSATAPQNIHGPEMISSKPKTGIPKSQSSLDLLQEVLSEDVETTEWKKNLPKSHSTMALLQAVPDPEELDPEIQTGQSYDFKCPVEKKFVEQVKVSSTPRSRIPRFERTQGLETPSPRVLKPKIPASQIPLFKDSKIQTPRIKIPNVPKF